MLCLHVPFASDLVSTHGSGTHAVSLANYCERRSTGYRLTDWVSFLVLDIGDPTIESIPVGTRMAVGLLQAAAVRAAGFTALSLSGLAPAVKYVATLFPRIPSSSMPFRVLYVIMMYISIYPLGKPLHFVYIGDPLLESFQ